MSLPANSPAFSLAPAVREALEFGRPVVALESTFFTHGLPGPRNVEVAKLAEQHAGAAGAVPATIGVIDGVPTVGLTDTEIERLGADESVTKLSIRDLPVAAAREMAGGTTVAATAFLAHKAGIDVFATGGLGGVHHDAETTFDESADLVALAHTPIAVVSAGVKSILNIPATLERLETLNIPLIGYRTTYYPGFYVADSGHRIEHRVDTPAQAAAVITAHGRLGMSSAVLVANPVPESEQLDPARHEELIGQAWRAAHRDGIAGKDITPFLLEYIRQATDGESLEVNIAVYRNNVAVGAAIARALAG